MALAGCGGTTHPATGGRVASDGAPVSSAPAVARHPVKRAQLVPNATPAMRALQAVLAKQLAKAGPETGGLVYDMTDHAQLFGLRINAMRPPASVEKIYTSVAVLNTLGPDARLSTSVLGKGHLGRGGVWHGDLYLRGGGDPTYGDGGFNRVWEGGYGPTAGQLVRQLERRGIRRVTGRVIGDASLFDSRRGPPSSAFAADIPDIGGQLAALTYDHGATSRRLSPGAFAAKELVLTMRGAHIRARAATFTASTPAGARPLASVESPQMSVLLRLMDVPSDDFFAEMLAKQMGVRFGGEGTTAAGAQVISNEIGALGVHPRIVDGSGLSRDDRSSPKQVVELLRRIWGTPTGRELEMALPVVGVNGTTQTIGVRTAAQGHCVAKTGSLDNVTNLAGYCNARGHHMVAFALMLDGPENAQAFMLLGRMVGVIARY